MENSTITTAQINNLLNQATQQTTLKYRQNFLKYCSIFFFVATLLALLVSLAPLLSNSEIVLSYTLSNLFAMGIASFTWWLANKGKVIQGSWLLIITLWLILNFFMLITSPTIFSLLSFLPIVMMSLILIGRIAAIINLLWSFGLGLFQTINQRLVYDIQIDGNNQLVDFEILILVFILKLLVIGLAIYLASSISKSNDLVLAQAEQLAIALQDIEAKRAVGEEVSQKVFSLSAELRATSAQQANGSQQQAGSLIEITNFTKNLVNIALTVSEKAKNLLHATESIKLATNRVTNSTGAIITVSEKGTEAVVKTIEASQKASEVYADVRNKLHELREQQSQIKTVIALLDEISNETRLLALNAAIEAAGAGQYGDRFSIVANEVKALADRSKEASQEIGQILSQVEKNIIKSAIVAESGQKQIQIALGVARESGEVIGELASTLKQNITEVVQIEQATELMNSQTEEISLVIRQQHSASSQAVSTLEEIEMVANQSAVSSVELSKSAKDLEGLSQNLLKVLAA
jgi:methyl-accepting chemotaxis protein